MYCDDDDAGTISTIARIIAYIIAYIIATLRSSSSSSLHSSSSATRQRETQLPAYARTAAAS
jgi:hypothetical protein